MRERPGFDPWVGKIAWRRDRLHSPVLWPGEFHGLCSPWVCKELDTTEQLSALISCIVMISLSIFRLFSLSDCKSYNRRNCIWLISAPGIALYLTTSEVQWIFVEYMGERVNRNLKPTNQSEVQDKSAKRAKNFVGNSVSLHSINVYLGSQIIINKSMEWTQN